MKKRGGNRVIIFAAAVLVVVFVVTLFLFFCRDKKALRISFSEEKTDLVLSEYEDVSLLCRTAQMTGVWFVAVAVKDSTGNYLYLNRPQELYVTGDDPFVCLNDELTLYSSNHFILEGDLVYDTDNWCGSGYALHINNWDIEYPIETTLRPFFMRSFIYSFEYIAD